MSAPLDVEVAAALESAGFGVRAFHRLSKLCTPELGRVVYRIELDSGRTIKARRVQDENAARRLFEIRRDLPEAFAAAFDRYGAVLLEEWIEGEPVGDAPPGDAYLIEAGALLASLHARPIVAGQRVHEMRSTAAWLDATERHLQQIQAAGGLEERDALRIRAALTQGDPGRALTGLTHTDFCGENMVVDRRGRLRVVDNERVGIEALGFDVARTWYRWGLPAPSWERLQAAYAASTTTAEPLTSLGFWRIVALAHSAALRLRMDRTRAHVPLERLRQLAVASG